MAQVREEIKGVIEKLYSARYLFDPAHDLFRVLVSPESSGGLQLPPSIPLANLLNHSEVACTVTSLSTDKEKLDALHDAVKLVQSIAVETSESGEVSVRRKSFLLPGEDPALRTVVMRPVHPEASIDEITSFLSSFGEIEEVQRRKLFSDSDKFKNTANIVFKSQASAELCASAKHTFGTLAHPLGQHFVPKITAAMLCAFQDQQSEQNRLAEQKQLQKNIVDARREIAACGADVRTPFQAKKFLLPGRTVKCAGVPDGVSWQELKAKVGNLALSRPGLKGAVTLVKIVDPNEEDVPFLTKKTAFIIVKNQAAVEELVTTYAMATGDFIEQIRRVCPNLSVLSEQEDTWVRKQFPTWTEKKVEMKADANRKRGRE